MERRLCHHYGSTKMRCRGAKIRFFSGAILLSGALTAHAQSADEQTATVKFFSHAPSALEWKGRGDVSVSQPFCVQSSTGQFELVVSSASGAGMTGHDPMPYEVTVELNGAVRTGTISRHSPSFRVRGHSDRSLQCNASSNGRLTVRLLQQDALAAVSGSYADQLTVSADPM